MTVRPFSSGEVAAASVEEIASRLKADGPWPDGSSVVWSDRGALVVVSGWTEVLAAVVVAFGTAGHAGHAGPFGADALSALTPAAVATGTAPHTLIAFALYDLVGLGFLDGYNVGDRLTTPYDLSTVVRPLNP